MIIFQNGSYRRSTKYYLYSRTLFLIKSFKQLIIILVVYKMEETELCKWVIAILVTLLLNSICTQNQRVSSQISSDCKQLIVWADLSAILIFNSSCTKNGYLPLISTNYTKLIGDHNISVIDVQLIIRLQTADILIKVIRFSQIIYHAINRFWDHNLSVIDGELKFRSEEVS